MTAVDSNLDTLSPTVQQVTVLAEMCWEQISKTTTEALSNRSKDSDRGVSALQTNVFAVLQRIRKGTHRMKHSKFILDQDEILKRVVIEQSALVKQGHYPFDS